MSFDPTNYPQIRYRGIPTYQTVGIFNANTMSNRFVPLDINWLIYFTALNNAANIAIPFDLQGGQNQGGLLDKIVSVKIDNTNSTISVSVFFPDTGDIITCPPETVITLPAMTNALNGYIIAQGLSEGFTPRTKIFLTNFLIPASVDPQLQINFPQWIGSPTIQRANALTPGYGPPALGDQMTIGSMSLVTGVPFSLFGGAKASGFYYITALHAQVSSVSSAAVSTNGLVYFQSTGGDLLFAVTFGGQLALNDGFPVLTLSGMNIRIPATTDWFCSKQAGAFNNGEFLINVAYSYQP